MIVPPLEWDPDTGEELPRDYVTVGPAGTVTSWCWVGAPTEQHPLTHPFAFSLITLDGADTSLLHAVDTGDIGLMSVGMRVAPRWRADRTGHITDVEAFVPGEVPVLPDGDAGPPDEPVAMMAYNASVTYSLPVTRFESKVRQANEERLLLGLRCPTCGRIYTGGEGILSRRCSGLHRRGRSGAAPDGHHNQLHHHHPRPIPGPDGDRAVPPGLRPPRRLRCGPRLPTARQLRQRRHPCRAPRLDPLDRRRRGGRHGLDAQRGTRCARSRARRTGSIERATRRSDRHHRLERVSDGAPHWTRPRSSCCWR